MLFRVCFALLLWVSACASVPAPPEMSRSSAFVPTPSPNPRIQFVSARTDSQQPPIGKADLEQARALLFQAHNDLKPRQWEALNGKLTAAERAFERFAQATKASGQAAEVMRGTERLAQVGRAKAWVEVLPRVGPLLVFLVLLYPSSTAGPEVDRRPEWVDAQGEYEARLRELAEESRWLMEERVPQDAEEAVPDFDSDLFAAVTVPTPWWKKPNPATGKPYTSVEEYDRIPRHAEQTCKNSRLDELEAEKKLFIKSVPPYDPKAPRSKNVEKLDKVPCSRIRLRREAMKRVLEKRWEIEKECFGGKPDPGHDTTMTELEQGIAKTEKLEKRNCAPGHPMAEL
jgi:hypothetical protein